jgi:hypothetical protein
VSGVFQENDYTLLAEEYKNNEQLLPFVCNTHRNEGIQYISFGSLITGGRCKYCTKVKSIINHTKTHEQFLSEVKNIHGNKYKIIGKYSGCKNHIEIFCNNCNESFWITPTHLLDGHGCSNCNNSIGENAIKQYLFNNNINFKQQHRFNDCVGIKRKLPFDFAIFQNDKLKFLVEYQGIQHYKPVGIFGGEEQLEKQKEYDLIKYRYCNDNNIFLLIIPYWDIKNIETILGEAIAS